MTSGTTLKQCASELRLLTESFKSVQGKPRNLIIVNHYLYWTQGVEQELYRVALDTSNSHDSPRIRGEVQRVITCHHDAQPEADDRTYCPHTTTPDGAQTTAAQQAEESRAALSREEELLRERTRSQLTGITSFRVRRSDDTVFFVRSIDLFIYYQTGPRAHQPPLKVMDYLSATDAAHFAKEGSRPHMFIQHITRVPPLRRPCYAANSSDTVVSEEAVKNAEDEDEDEDEEECEQLTTFTFVNNNNIYLAHVEEHAAQSSTPLTVTLTQVTHMGDAQHPCGVADYITQEEFDQLSGHVATSRYILFTVIDETKLRCVRLLKGTAPTPSATVSDTHMDCCTKDDDDDDADSSAHSLQQQQDTGATKKEEEEVDSVEEMRYARVGDVNSGVLLAVYERSSGHMRVLPPEWIAATLSPSSSSSSSSDMSSMAEYIPRFGFKDRQTIYLAVLDRAQTNYAVLSFTIAHLPRVASEAEVRAMLAQSRPRGRTTTPLMYGGVVERRQAIPWAWVEVMPGAPIHFNADGLDVLLCHDTDTPTAHTHLLTRRHHTSLLDDARSTRADNQGGSQESEGMGGRWRALTRGEWNVRPNSVQISQGCAYFIANAEGYLCHCLYAWPLPRPEDEGVMGGGGEGDEDAQGRARGCGGAGACTPQRLSPLDEHVYHFVVVDGMVVYVASTLQRPAELYLARHGGRDEQSPRCRSNDARRTRVAIRPYTAAMTTSSPLAVARTPLVFTIPNRGGVPLGVHFYPAVQQTAPSGAHESGDGCWDANVHADCRVSVSTTNRTTHASARRTPLVLFVYGGPHVQLVSASDYDGTCRAPVQLLAHHGISVAVVDNQMSNANGLRVLSVCKRNMAGFETDDYVDAVRFLCAASPDTVPGWPAELSLDSHRVGIFGWSYGGYATLLALSQAPHVFKMGFAGAPVGDWRLYDTGYTERYMGLLYEPPAEGDTRSRPLVQTHGSSSSSIGSEEVQPGQTSSAPRRGHRTVFNRAYETSCIGHFAHGFPDEPNRLFIAHGTLDENVHFEHTCHVIEALIQECKPYSALVYPGERHGLRQNIKSRVHHDALLVMTMSRYL